MQQEYSIHEGFDHLLIGIQGGDILFAMICDRVIKTIAARGRRVFHDRVAFLAGLKTNTVSRPNVDRMLACIRELC